MFVGHGVLLHNGSQSEQGNFCSRLSWAADWLVIWREATEWLRRLEIWKLGHRKLNKEQGTMLGFETWGE